MSAEETSIDISASIMKHIDMLKPIFPMRADIFIGDYSSQLVKGGCQNENTLTLVVEKLSKKSPKTTQEADDCDFLKIDEKAETHYWFDAKKYLSNDSSFYEQLNNKSTELEETVIVASIGEGLGSVLLPELISRLHDQNKPSVGLAIMPSQLQSPDASFNALWSLAESAKRSFPQVLIDRDLLEEYVGVDRKGSVLRGNAFLKYFIEILQAKDSFAKEFYELAKSYNLKMFTILSATGASLTIYGSLKNILDTTLVRPFAKFDLSSSSVLYALVRMPLHLKEKLTRGNIELIIHEWFKEKTNLKSAYVADPIYVDDGSDRLDIVLFLGGFNLAEMVDSQDKKVREIKNYAIKKGFVKEKEWKELIDNLAR